MSSSAPRGIDHVGVTVPDLEAASRFFEDAFGAVALYDNMVRTDPPYQGKDAETTLGLEAGASVIAMRMLRLGNGPGIELFEMRVPEQRPSARASDLGLQHFAVYVDDIAAAARRFEAAGGVLLTQPKEMLGIEKGEGNAFCYGRAPWGMTIELLCWPGKAKWETTAPAERYKAPAS